jgi:hypothetical protein
MRRDPRDDPPRNVTRYVPRPAPTIGDLRKTTCWIWINCSGCQAGTPFALAPLIIRWGSDASSDLIRRNARCSKCGYRGATVQHPGWSNTETSFQAFPIISQYPTGAS